MLDDLKIMSKIAFWALFVAVVFGSFLGVIVGITGLIWRALGLQS